MKKETHMKKRSRLATAVAVVLAAGVVSACGGGAAPDDGDPAAAPGDATPAEPAGDGTETDATEEAGEDGALVIDGETVASAELYQAAMDEGLVSVYTAIPGGHEALWEAFTRDTGIEVEGLRLPTGKLSQRILSEVAADQFPADVIAMPDRTAWKQFVDEDIIEPYRPPAADHIPEEYSDPSLPYIALSLAPNTPAINTELVSDDEVPTHWEDLLDERWRGSIGFKPGPAGSGGWALALFTRQEFGIDYWEALAKQDARLESSASAVAESLAKGEFGIAVNRPPTIQTLQNRGAPVELLFLEGGTPMAVYFIGQVAESAGSTNPSAAQVFINWSVAKAGQDVLATEVGDYPVNERAVTPSVGGEELPGLSEIDPWVAKTEDWIGLRDEWVAEWEEIFNYRG